MTCGDIENFPCLAAIALSSIAAFIIKPLRLIWQLSAGESGLIVFGLTLCE
jgi:hypothetical protein